MFGACSEQSKEIHPMYTSLYDKYINALTNFVLNLNGS